MFGRFLFLLALAAGMGFRCQPEPIAQNPKSVRTFGPPQLAVQLTDPAITESSGLARSHAFPGNYYTHNDSGDSARFWRFNLQGQVTGPISVQGANAIDWEDMASARLDGQDYLYFADIGDNSERRDSVQIYRAPEPAAGSLSVVATRFDLKYPDGAHNAEAFMVDPSSGAFYIVTKSSLGTSSIFKLANPVSGPAQTMTLVGTIAVGTSPPGRLVTGGDFSEDGKYLIVRTYLDAYEFVFDSRKTWWTKPRKRVATNAEIQGEAIAYSSDGRWLLTTSEFSPCPVSRSEIRSP